MGNKKGNTLLSDIVALYVKYAPAKICKFPRPFNYTYMTTKHREQLRDALIAKYVEVEV